MSIDAHATESHSRPANGSPANPYTPSGLPTPEEAMRYLGGTYSWDAFHGRNAVEGALASTFGITVEDAEVLTGWLIAAGYLLDVRYDSATGHVSRILRGRTQVFTQAVDRGWWVTRQGRVLTEPLARPDTDAPRAGLYLTASAAERHFA
ncbi:hypothetical protein [Streptomyces sp. NPDC001165]|uniref:hypothetical protein n=1 Tax=Streptomyces sp. NPDC001165 TaxID=3364546 RepID=UPI0036C7EDB2